MRSEPKSHLGPITHGLLNPFVCTDHASRRCKHFTPVSNQPSDPADQQASSPSPSNDNHILNKKGIHLSPIHHPRNAPPGRLDIGLLLFIHPVLCDSSQQRPRPAGRIQKVLQTLDTHPSFAKANAYLHSWLRVTSCSLLAD